jgi:hypothetical protein
MYLFSLMIVINGITSYDEIWAENTRDAMESGEIKYPYADYIEVM